MSAKGRIYTSGDQVKAALQTQDTDALTKALVLLRNQLSFSVHESITPQDNRLILTQQWLTASPEAQDIFTLWQNADPHQSAFVALLLSILASTLSLLTSHYPYHVYGHPIAKKLLEPSYTRVLKGYIGGANHDLIIAALKIYNSVSNFASGRERKAVLETFPWELKSLPKLMNMRRKTKMDDPMNKPDIRTLYISLMLSFIDIGSSPTTKAIFLEQHRDAFVSMFKGLHQDPYIVIRKVLEACWSGMWGDSKLKRTLKISVFNERTLSQLSRIYERVEGGGDVPADLVHHFLLAVCTHPGMGVCFKDNGWYHRDNSDDYRPFAEEGEDVAKGKIFNKILNNFLRNLKPNEDSRQQELVLKILSACPELVAGFWSSAGLTLEPRLSSRWFTNIAIFGSVVRLPVPTHSFLLPGHESMYRPSPPLLSAVIENILPTSLGKTSLTKALQPTSRTLVQHATAIALCNSLTKYFDVMKEYQRISETLEETEQDGLWAKGRQDLEREARKRVPDFQVIVAFTQRTNAEAGSDAKLQLLAESSHRLLWLYHHCLPEMVSEARFDVGKLLVHFLPVGNDDGERAEHDQSELGQLNDLKQMHILRILEVSDQFSWTAKYGSSKHSSLHILMKSLISTRIEAIHSTLAHLIKHLLSESIIFEDNADEVELWLSSLPTTRRPASGSEAPDGTPLTDELTGVLIFLDECIQRCIKTPYRYIEDLQSYESTSSKGPNGPSPLLMTFKEQFLAKIHAKSLSPSDTLALSTFSRKLLLRLRNSVTDVAVIDRLSEQLSEALQPENLFPDFPLITCAIVKEAQIMQYCVGHLQLATLPPPAQVPQDVREFLTAVEKLEPPATLSARITSAFELVDWLRLLDSPIRASEMIRLVLIVYRYYPLAVRQLVQAAHPGYNLIWDGPTPAKEIQASVDFEWLFVSSSQGQLQEPGRRKILVDIAFAGDASIASIRRCLCQVEHALTVAVHSDTLTASLLLLLDDLLRYASCALPANYASLKEHVFVLSQSVRQFSTAPALSGCVSEAMKELVEHNLEALSVDDRLMVIDIATSWTKTISGNPTDDHLRLAALWVPFLDIEGLLNISILLSDRSMESAEGQRLLEIVLGSMKMQSSLDEEAADFLSSKLEHLIALRSRLPTSAVVEDILATSLNVMQPMLFSGKVQRDVEIDTALIHRAEAQWSRRLRSIPDLQLLSFLNQDEWTAATVDIMRCLIYRDANAQASFSVWLRQGNLAKSPTLLADLIHSYLDASACRGVDLVDADVDCWIQLHNLLVRWSFDQDSHGSLREIATSCLSHLCGELVKRSSDVEHTLVKELGNLPVTFLWPDMVHLGRSLISDCPSFATALAEHSAQWAVRLFNDEQTGDNASRFCLEEFVRLLESLRPQKSHPFEPLLTVITQDQLSNLQALRLLYVLIKHIPFKPLVVNRVLQSIVQYHRFTKLCSAPLGTHSPLRDALVDVIHQLFYLYPANTCQVTHVVPLIHIYYGTASLADRKLLSIFRLFETQRKTSMAIIFSTWDAAADGASSGSLEAIQSMDSNLLHRTCLQFPSWRKLEEQTTEFPNVLSVTYDPVFVLLLLSHTLSEDPPQTTFAWIELIRTNVIGLVVRALAARDDHLRELALCILAVLWEQLETTDMVEATPIKHALWLLRNDIPPPASGEPPRRLPTYTALLLAHSIRSIIYPHQFLYPITAKFLLQRPELDSTDVPMLFGMLYSNSDDWKKERVWMIHFLADGLVSSEDWKVFKRRHTWDLLASIFQSSIDRGLRKAIFEVLANLTCIPQAVVSLVLKSGLLSWIEMQMNDVRDNEAALWLKILENVMTVGHSERIEANTNGQWRWSISRCLASVLRRPSARAPNILSLSSRVLLRLMLLSRPDGADLHVLLRVSFERLVDMEAASLRDSLERSTPTDQLVHSSAHLHSEEADGWGQIVENLWRVSMAFEGKDTSWDALTSRLLLWQVRGKGNGVANWVRIETLNASQM